MPNRSAVGVPTTKANPVVRIAKISSNHFPNMCMHKTAPGPVTRSYTAWQNAKAKCERFGAAMLFHNSAEKVQKVGRWHELVPCGMLQLCSTRR